MDIKSISQGLLDAARAIMEETVAAELQEKTKERKIETLGNKVKAANAMKKKLNTKMQGAKYEKLTQRARAASDKARSLAKEEVEQTDEAVGRDNENRKGWAEYSKKYNVKMDGDTTPETKRANRASKKLTTTTDPKEKTALRMRRAVAWDQADRSKNNASIYNNAKKLQKEEVENIDEISKKKALDYIGAASTDKSHRAHEIGADNAAGYHTGEREMSRKELDKTQKAHGNRSLGIQRAAAKLAGKKHSKVPATEQVSFTVEHKEYGIGTTIPGQLYDDMTADVMFEEGIIIGVPMDDLEVIE